MSQYDLTDFEWRVIEPLLPNKPRGVPRVDDRRVLNGIFWVLRSGAPWRDLPERYGPRTTCYNRFVRWRKAGVWDRLMDAITVAHDGTPCLRPSDGKLPGHQGLGGEITGIVVLASSERPSARLSSCEKFLMGVYQLGVWLPACTEL